MLMGDNALPRSLDKEPIKVKLRDVNIDDEKDATDERPADLEAIMRNPEIPKHIRNFGYEAAKRWWTKCLECPEHLSAGAAGTPSQTV